MATLSIVFRLSLFLDPRRRRQDEAVLEYLLEGLVRANVALLETDPTIPRLYASGVRYQREPRGLEWWGDAREVMELGFGDCDDLACWRAAELRVSGEDPTARPVVTWYPRPDGGRTYHVRVARRGMAEPEDPSVRLGMPPIPTDGRFRMLLATGPY